LDYVCGWFYKFATYASAVDASCAFVSTNSISQGEQVARLWPLILEHGLEITFAHTSFKWSNLAAHNAGVTVVVVGLGKKEGRAILYENSDVSAPSRREVNNICAYLVAHENIIVSPLSDARSQIAEMVNGNKPADGGNLILDFDGVRALLESDVRSAQFVRKFVGAADSIRGIQRFCLWISDQQAHDANRIEAIAERVSLVRKMREESPKALTQRGALVPHAFQQIRQTGNEMSILIPRHSSVSRSHLPISLQSRGTIIADGAFAIFDSDLWNFAILGSRIHLVWVAAVCGKIKMDYRYSSTLGWNTFPIANLTDQNKSDLTRCAEDILLSREAHFPATIADLYDPKKMPSDLKEAHERNDETLERIYIGRRFKNDTERLEKLFELYAKMIAEQPARAIRPARSRKAANA
jgi:hypothetical protein